jgi:threonine synthase
MVAVQAEPVTPVVEAFQEGWSEVRPRRAIGPKSLADGIAVEQPVRSRSILSALRHSNGTAISVVNKEITRAREQLAMQGLFVEPTSATAAAALSHLRSQISPGETVVVNLTGLGLKKLPTSD